MSVPRTLNSPADVNNYADYRVIFRSGTITKSGPKIVEAAWNGTADHPPEKVSFLADGQGGWDKSLSLRMGDVPVTPYTPPPPSDKSAPDFEAWAIARVGSVAAWQNLLERCAAHVGTSDNDKAVRYFPRWSALPGSKSKAEFEARCTPLTLTNPVIISPAALAAVLTQW